MRTLSKSEYIALNQFIHEYPSDKDFHTILEMIIEGHGDITIQEYYVDWYRPTLMAYILDLCKEIHTLNIYDLLADALSIINEVTQEHDTDDLIEVYGERLAAIRLELEGK